MSRVFNGTTDKLVRLSTPITAYPFTLACWFKATDLLGVYTLMNLGWTGGSDVAGALVARGTDAGSPLTAQTNGTIAALGNSTTPYTAGVWQHGAGVFTSLTSRTGYLNGGSPGLDTTNVGAVTAPDSAGIGVFQRSSPAAFFSGSLAHAAGWNVQLTEAEIKLLSTGVSPLRVRPANLMIYVPVAGAASPEPDVLNTTGYTVTGTSAGITEPPMVGGNLTNSLRPAIFKPGLAR